MLTVSEISSNMLRFDAPEFVSQIHESIQFSDCDGKDSTLTRVTDSGMLIECQNTTPFISNLGRLEKQNIIQSECF